MTTKRWILALLASVLIAVLATMLAHRIFEDETPVLGAIPGTIQSEILGEAREYFVHLPEGYDADTTTRYPVLYVLDGTSQSGHTAESASLLARIGVIPPMIVVGVPSLDGGTRNRDYTPPEMRLDTDAPTGPMGAADRFLSFLKDEQIGRIERDYRTTRPRMLAGWSRGGLFVVYALTEHPELFESYHAHSPALWRSGSEMVARLERFLSERPELASELFLSLGGEENPKMTEAFRSAVAALEARAPAGLRWRAEITPGAGHQENPERATPVALSWAAATGPAPVR